MRKLGAVIGMLAAWNVLSQAVAAEKHYGPGVTDTKIKIGEVMPYSGPEAPFEVMGQAEAAYFKMVNEHGGVNGRRIVFISLDSAVSPPKALEAVRRLVEQDRVFAMEGDQGTAVNFAVQRYLTDAKVPNLFVRTGASRFNDPKHFPWTIPGGPLFVTEGRIYGKYILATKPTAKVAVLYQHDDYGRDLFSGLRQGLGSRADAMIAATATYEISDPTVDSQIIALHGSGADTVLYIASPKFAAMAIRKVGELGWRPLQIVSFPSATVTVMKAAGTAAATGAVVAFSVGADPSDPTRSNDPDIKKRKRGRPPLKPNQRKRASFNTRLRQEVKDKLSKEAEHAGRSLSEEIEHRLEASLAYFPVPVRGRTSFTRRTYRRTQEGGLEEISEQMLPPEEKIHLARIRLEQMQQLLNELIAMLSEGERKKEGEQ